MNELRILNGLSRGSAFPFDEDQISLGASRDADIFISDPGIYEKHAVFSKNSEGAYSVEIFNEDSSSNTIEALNLGTPIAILGVWVCLAGEDDDWNMQLPESLPADNALDEPEAEELPSKHRSKPRFPLIPIVLISVVFTLSFKMFAFANISNVDLGDDNVGKGDRLKSHIVDTNSPSDHEINTDQMLVEKFKRMLMERELKGLIIDDNPKKWTISGNLNESGKSKLHRTIKRFEFENTFSFVIENNTSSIPTTLPFKLTRIVSGPYGHVITDKGKRLSVGGSLDGYTLKSVGKKKVVFQGENTIELVW